MKNKIRKLTDEEKFQAKSCPEIRDGIADEAKRLRRNGLKWVYKISHGPLLNALIAWYMDQTPAQREKIAREGLEALTAILSKPYEAPGSAPAPANPSKVDGTGGSARRTGKYRNSEKPIS
jgi:hypothetical protein